MPRLSPSQHLLPASSLYPPRGPEVDLNQRSSESGLCLCPQNHVENADFWVHPGLPESEPPRKEPGKTPRPRVPNAHTFRGAECPAHPHPHLPNLPPSLFSSSSLTPPPTPLQPPLCLFQSPLPAACSASLKSYTSPAPGLAKKKKKKKGVRHFRTAPPYRTSSFSKWPLYSFHGQSQPPSSSHPNPESHPRAIPGSVFKAAPPHVSASLKAQR